MFKKKKQEEVIEAVKVVAVEEQPSIVKINNIKEEVVELPVEEATI